MPPLYCQFFFQLGASFKNQVCDIWSYWATPCSIFNPYYSTSLNHVLSISYQLSEALLKLKELNTFFSHSFFFFFFRQLGSSRHQLLLDLFNTSTALFYSPPIQILPFNVHYSNEIYVFTTCPFLCMFIFTSPLSFFLDFNLLKLYRISNSLL